MTHGRFAKALRNDGFSATVSPRALKSRLPILGSLDQLGRSPEGWRSMSRSSSRSPTAKSRRCGPTFQLGCPSGSRPAARAASSSRARRTGGVKRATRPHMGPFWREIAPLARVTTTGYCYEHMFAFSSNRPTLPEDLVATLRPVALAKSRMLPLGEPWGSLVPNGGLSRGSTVVVQAPPGLGGLSLALSLLTESSARGHWSAVVGVDDPGVVAIADLGVDLRRVLFVPRPRGAWAESAADLLDGVDLLIVRPPSRASHGAARRLIDRVRERGTVLIVLAEPASLWPLPADISFDITNAQWATSSRLDARYLTVRIGGQIGR